MTTQTVPVQPWAKNLNPIYPAQCSCGHIILEKFIIRVNESTAQPFDWCGFCRTRTNLPTMEIPEVDR